MVKNTFVPWIFIIHEAYFHMPVGEQSAMLQAISTHLGVYKVKRLMFGVEMAPKGL